MNNYTRINEMVEQLYKFMEEKGLSVNEAYSIVFELKLKMDKAKEVIGNEPLKEVNKFKMN